MLIAKFIHLKSWLVQILLNGNVAVDSGFHVPKFSTVSTYALKSFIQNVDVWRAIVQWYSPCLAMNSPQVSDRAERARERERDLLKTLGRDLPVNANSVELCGLNSNATSYVLSSNRPYWDWWVPFLPSHNTACLTFWLKEGAVAQGGLDQTVSTLNLLDSLLQATVILPELIPIPSCSAVVAVVSKVDLP